MKYNFKIDKNTCFIYWLQSLVDWDFYSESRYKKERLYYLKVLGEFSDEEKKRLESFKSFLQKEDKGYKWLWEVYSDENSFDSKKEEKIIFDLKKDFKKKFEILWKKEKPKIEYWVENLNNSIERIKLKEFLKKVTIFFDTKKEVEIIDVYLLIGGNHAHIKKGSNFFLMAVSLIESIDDEKLISSIVHESCHLIEYCSKKSGLLLKNSYNRTIGPLGIKKKNPSWRHLIIESVIGSIVGYNFSYFNLNNSFDLNKEKFESNLKKATFKITILTNQYLNQGRKIDKEYSNEVMNIWKKIELDH